MNFKLDDDFAKAIFVFYLQLIMHFALYFLIGVVEEKFFTTPFFAFLLFWIFIYKFIHRSLFQQNYSYWALNLLALVFFLKSVFTYTFVESHIVALYFSFLGLIFLFMNAYIMSSPLFFPRVQWWEYDFRYRGDLKIKIDHNGDRFPARLTDLRRSEACVEAFEDMKIRETFNLEIELDEKLFSIKGEIKTKKQIIPGRPFRYGIKIEFISPLQRKNFYELEKYWKNQKKVKMRRKFSDVVTSDRK